MHAGKFSGVKPVMMKRASPCRISADIMPARGMRIFFRNTSHRMPSRTIAPARQISAIFSGGNAR